MSAIDLDVSIETDTSALDRILEKSARLNEILNAYANEIVAYAQGIVPIDTGALHDSIEARVLHDGFVVEAGRNLPDARARFQEYGFHHVGTNAFIINPFLRPAMDFYRDDLVIAIAALVGDLA
jgi:hypothetical protein